VTSLVTATIIRPADWEYQREAWLATNYVRTQTRLHPLLMGSHDYGDDDDDGLALLIYIIYVLFFFVDETGASGRTSILQRVTETVQDRLIVEDLLAILQVCHRFNCLFE
jgi:hypothetical protein